MPDATITNPSGFFGQAAQPNPTVKYYLNGSGTTRKPGDAVVLSRVDLTGTVVTAASTLNDVLVVGIVAPPVPTDSMNTQSATTTYPAGSDMPVIIDGPSRVNIGANTVAVADLLTPGAATPGVCQTNAAAPAADTITGSVIACALEASAAKDANNTVRCYVSKV